MNAVAEDRTGSGQAWSGVNVDVALRLREQGRDTGDLGFVLVGMGLDVAVRKLALERPRRRVAPRVDVTAKRGVIA